MFEFTQKLQETEGYTPENDDFIAVICGRSTLTVLEKNGVRRFPRWRELKDFLYQYGDVILIGKFGDIRCLALEIPELPGLPEMFSEIPIRQFLFEFDEDHRLALCRARGLIAWRRQHRFCGVCRAELIASENDCGLVCPDCGTIYYPQLAPAVIAAVTRNNGKELLLAHNRSFAGNVYSLIAGFVETGETIEAAVHREIYEECSIRVRNVRYLSSQVWPFPNSLMLAFAAEYDSGTVHPDGEELSDAQWFSKDNLPDLPASGSIARNLINDVFNL